MEIAVAFIYFNGVLERKESTGKIFWGYFCMAVIINFIRTNLYLSFAANISVTVILWLFIVFLCFDGSISKKLFFTVLNAVAIVMSEILTASVLSTVLKIEYDDGFTARYLGIALSETILFVFDIFTIYIAKKDTEIYH